MTVLLHAHYHDTEVDRSRIRDRAAYMTTVAGFDPEVAYQRALEEFISSRLPNNVDLVLAEEL